MVKLKKPVLCEVDENYFVSAADFRSYAHCMMYPDPVGIVMSGKLNDIVTGAVNDGKLTIKEAFDKLVKRNAHGFIDYSYSDGTDGYLPGRELLEFCDEATAAKLIEVSESRCFVNDSKRFVTNKAGLYPTMVQTLLSFASKTGRVLLTVFRQATKTLLRT